MKRFDIDKFLFDRPDILKIREINIERELKSLGHEMMEINRNYYSMDLGSLQSAEKVILGKSSIE